MDCLIQRMDQQVIHVDYQPALHNVISEEIVHEGLEHGWEVAHSEEHDVGFEQPKWGGKGGLPAVLWLDENIVIFPSYIKFGED